MDEIIRSTADWEQFIGDQIRVMRIGHEMNQSELAVAANLSVGAVKNIENGRGSSLKTLILIVRAMGEERWFELLSPLDDFSPIRALRDQNLNSQRRRVFKSKSQSKR
ncbi:MAG: helix-turn-helix transcriptional regulator [Gallionella sp.]|nr:helix-turn-helix transcriptional regulator [Gallionella sp.]